MIEPARADRGRPLASGLAHVLTRLARARGAPEPAIAVLERAIEAVINAAANGQVSVDLRRVAPADADDGGDATDAADATDGTDAADAADTVNALLATGMVARPGAAQPAPLVLDAAGRLYLHRYHQYETRLADALIQRAGRPDLPINEAAASAALAASFTASAAPTGEPDLQKVAVALALLRPFTVISGGPGTGKTSTVLALLRTLLALEPGLRIALAAPTGKAAARLLDTLRHRGPTLAGLPGEAFTIHRLLRPIPGTTRFRHDREHPLALDVLVVDEASMLDLALATKLVEALPAHARLILLGDKDQLAAVEAGSIFHDLAAAPGLRPATGERVARLAATRPEALPGVGAPSLLADSTIWLRHSYRFAGASDIGRAAALLRDDTDYADHADDTNRPAAADAADPCIFLEHSASLLDLIGRPDSAVRLIDCPDPVLSAEVVTALGAGYRSYLDALHGLAARPGPKAEAAPAGAAAAATLLAAFDAHRILCVLRQGERGVDHLNALLTRLALQHAGQGNPSGNPWFAGRPVMILANDHGLRLYNGDIGIALPDAAGRMLVWFPDPRDPAGAPRSVAAARLPRHETAFATTVHKAQGSEFDTVSLVLPARPSPLADRALLYTAVTRARNRVDLYGTAGLLAQAAALRGMRAGGLADRFTPEQPEGA